jgi:hypothetical protein
MKLTYFYQVPEGSVEKALVTATRMLRDQQGYDGPELTPDDAHVADVGVDDWGAFRWWVFDFVTDPDLYASSDPRAVLVPRPDGFFVFGRVPLW